MNNDKYSKYGNGRVRYGSNGAYSVQSSTSRTGNGSSVMTVLFVLLLVLIALFVAVSKVNAEESHQPTVTYTEGCQPYTRSMVMHSASGFSHNPHLSYGSDCTGVNPTEENDSEITPPPSTSTDTPPAVTPVPTDPIIMLTPEPTDPPVIITPEVTPSPDIPTEDKQKCNAGRGNGSEGNPDCDPGNSGGHNNGGD